jgi:hypothetical protein
MEIGGLVHAEAPGRKPLVPIENDDLWALIL